MFPTDGPIEDERRSRHLGWLAIDLAIAARRPLSSKRWARATPLLMLAPALTLVGLLALGLARVVWISLHSFDAFTLSEGPLSFEQYGRVFGSEGGSYRSTFLRTLLVSTAVGALATALAVPTAHMIVRMRRGARRSLALLALLVPFLMGDSIRAFAWLVLLGSDGVVPWVFARVGLRDVALLGETYSIAIGLLVVQVPLATLMMIPAMRAVPPDLERAATTLGARPRQVWTSVVLPLVRKSMALVYAVCFSLGMTEYAIPLALGLGSRPFTANAIQTIFFGQGNSHFGAAMSVLLIAAVVAGGATILAISSLRSRRGSERPTPPQLDPLDVHDSPSRLVAETSAAADDDLVDIGGPA